MFSGSGYDHKVLKILYKISIQYIVRMPSMLNLFILLLFLTTGCKKEVAPVQTPEEERHTFELAEDLEIQLVAHEPMVQEPVFMSFDENGRLWVVEMRGFMPNVEGIGEDDPVGRISVLIDKNMDGVMDTSVIFMDSLVLPRSLALVEGGVLVAERKPLWFVEDRDGDLHADHKTLIDSSYGGTGMPEHSPNGLLRGLDNWYYNAKSTNRYRLVSGKWIIDKTEFRGQWGISQDNLGRLYYNYNWSQLHADLVPPNYLSRNKNHLSTSGIDHGLTIDRKIFPARPNPATNRGYIDGTLDNEGRLLEFTSASAPFVYRGTALPHLINNVFVAEPAGNLIKRNVVDDRDLILSAASPYPDRDFLASTDERFRPVFFTSGPDGCLYFADMYHGIIEHGPYMTPYLKEQTIERGLDKHIHFGRIWRLIPKGFQQPALEINDHTNTASLIALLEHPNGWYRDMAQRLIIERHDPLSDSLLSTFISTSDNHLAKIHALYCLEGLNQLNADDLINLLNDDHAAVKAVVLRLLENDAGKNESLSNKLYETFLGEIGTNKYLDLQIALSAQVLPLPQKIETLNRIFEKYGQINLFRDAIMSSLENSEFSFLERLEQSEETGSREAQEVMIEMLATAIAKKGDAGEISNLLDKIELHNNALSEHQQAILRGLSLGKIAGRDPIKLNHPPKIINQIEQLDKGMKARLEKIISMTAWPGYYPDTSSIAKAQDLTAEELALFNLGRQHFTTSCAGCHGSEGEGLNRFAPPLVGSEWVLGDERRLTLLVLHGVEGPIEVEGKIYGAPDILPVMPSHSILDDQVIASILTYIRCEWGHNAKPVSPRTVSRLRHTTQGRVQPWKIDDLNNHVENLQE
ncbi:MAG: dehydrogenase [Saprospiraceae bacterium]|nr:dehydrogenase [Saprospiraceae bacterium]